ncbi:LysR family transcriptional regulator [Paracoccus gahaiensis]|uniref:LysR family transcriptional regulator n=1 Tax=Paracoccus gahaiensis TaxID=1706839 RepID=A0A4U0R5C5_9RHOB|nr:LysR family transcriptional regulator [Paracoccus gahaiensis]TJZ90163.1 LysR family transcriptional regulator [Paracoccus gahaiensis]
MTTGSQNTNIGLRHLRAVHAVRDEGSFARAAERLGVVPSALSETIRQLEEAAGLPLFDRRMRPPQITPAGRDFLVETAPVLQDMARAMARMQDRARLGSGRLSIGASPSAIRDLLAPALRVFRCDHPGVELIVHDGPADQLAQEVAEGVLDLAIAGHSGDTPLLHYRPITQDPFGLAVPQGHPLTQLERAPGLEDIDPDTLIHLEGMTGTSRLLASYADLPETFRTGPVRVQSTFGQLCLIRSGVGIGLLPRKAVLLFDDPNIVFLPIKGLSLARTISLIWPARRAMSHITTRFIEIWQRSVS